MTFFEGIFLMKDRVGHQIRELPSSSRQDVVAIFFSEPTISMQHLEDPMEDNNETPKMSKR